MIARANLERAATVVAFVLALPRHAVADLPRRSLGDMRQPEIFLLQPHQMRRQNHTTRVPGPMQNIQPGVILRQLRIPAIAENRLHKIQIADQTPRREEPRLHRLLRLIARRRTNHRTQQQRDKQPRLVLLIGGEGKRQRILRRRQRGLQQGRERALRNRLLISGNGKPSLDNMENTLRRPTIADRVMQNPLRRAIGAQIRRRETGALERNGQDPAQPRAVQDQRPPRQPRHRIAELLQIAIQEVLNARVGGAKVVLQQPDFVLVIPK